MGYGGFNTGGGASSYDLDRLAASIINGHVSAPLTTADGIGIATRIGEEIGAHYSRSAELAEIMQRMEAYREECMRNQYSLAADIIRGDVSAPLLTVDGEPIQDGYENLIFAHRVREDDRAYIGVSDGTFAA